MDTLELAQKRHATKVFDATRSIDDQTFAKVLELLRLSPSSTNLQPWKFYVAGTKPARAHIAKATTGNFAGNHSKITDASHVLVLCSKLEITDNDALQVLDKEGLDQRFDLESDKQTLHQRRMFFVDLHRKSLNDVQHWTAKQAYLALGHLLLGVAGLGISACPIEGFDAQVLSKELGLADKGLAPQVIVSLGYASPNDFNAKLPKSRLKPADIFEWI